MFKKWIRVGFKCYRVWIFIGLGSTWGCGVNQRKERELQRENNIEKDTGREGKRGHAQVRMVKLGATVLKIRLISRLILFDGSPLNITLIALIMYSGD